ncbi:hypothetical protein CTAM01_10003, partial [Colletotrichum tamarilloi]
TLAIDTPAQPAEELIFNYLCPVLSPCTLGPQVPGTRTLISITLKATERGSACGVQLQSSCNYSACRSTLYANCRPRADFCPGISVPKTPFCDLLGLGLPDGHRTAATACAELQTKGLNKHIGRLLSQIPRHTSR